MSYSEGGNMKYYGTLGPSSMEESILKGLIEEGMTGIRINLSHVNLWEIKESIDLYQKLSIQGGHEQPDILIDLQGAEERIGLIMEENELEKDDMITLIINTQTKAHKTIPLKKELFDRLELGVCFIVDDGKLRFEVVRDVFMDKFNRPAIMAKTIRGGYLSSGKSILLEGISIENPTLTLNDLENIKYASDFGVTGVMLPFVRGKEDIDLLRKALKANNGEQLQILAKIENEMGVLKLAEIASVADEIVIARGDLGNAIPLYKLPVVQAEIAEICNKMKIPFMVVTQMLASMETQQIPTRAEVNDIFHGIQQGASSIMLTGETAKEIGRASCRERV